MKAILCILSLQMIESLSISQLKSPVRPLVTNTNLHLLWPQPQKIIELSGPGFIPQKQLHISVLQGTASIHRYKRFEKEFFVFLYETVLC